MRICSHPIVIKVRLNGIDKTVNVEPENLRFQDMMDHRQSPNGSPNGRSEHLSGCLVLKHLTFWDIVDSLPTP